ncbi:NAD(P)H-dependent oxidoreductase [Candidatus Sumerlaeota bacterium]|nr:NAD(P)H-dependent oxidoreductase [Candidatus Sumerlaeota bacterium]
MIEVISGTNRPGANALKIAKHLVAMYERRGANARLYNLQDLPAEIFDPSSYAEKPEAFAPFQQRILAAQGLHIVTPEYNGSIPGIMKYFIDMLKFPESFDHRCVAFTGEAAGIWGALRPVEQLQMIFGYRNAHILPERVFIPGVNKVLDEHGGIVDDVIRTRLEAQVEAFIAFTARFA